MPEKPQNVVFVENYADDETRLSYYRGDNVQVTEGEYRRAMAVGAVRDASDEEAQSAMRFESGKQVPATGGDSDKPEKQQAMPPNPAAQQQQGQSEQSSQA